MKTVLFALVFSFFMIQELNAQKNVNSNHLVSLLRFDGVYSFNDSTRDNDGVKYLEKINHITPFVFNKNGTFQQFPFSTNDAQYLSKTFKNQHGTDKGQYIVADSEIIITGSFTFYRWGMRLRQYKANFQCTIDSTGNYLTIKIMQPYPKINMRLNNDLRDEIAGKIYVFKKVSID